MEGRTNDGGEDHEDEDEGGGDDDEQVQLVPRPLRAEGRRLHLPGHVGAPVWGVRGGRVDQGLARYGTVEYTWVWYGMVWYGRVY